MRFSNPEDCLSDCESKQRCFHFRTERLINIHSTFTTAAEKKGRIKLPQAKMSDQNAEETLVEVDRVYQMLESLTSKDADKRAEAEKDIDRYQRELNVPTSF